MTYHISPIKRFYKLDCSPMERLLLESLGVPLRFEALSIGRTPEGATVCLVPLDESNHETAKLLSAAEDMRDALVAILKDAGHIRHHTPHLDDDYFDKARQAVLNAGVKL